MQSLLKRGKQNASSNANAQGGGTGYALTHRQHSHNSGSRGALSQSELIS